MASKIITTQDLAVPLLKTFALCGCDPKYSGIGARVLYWYFTMMNLLFMGPALIKCAQQTSLDAFTKSFIDFLIVSQIGTKGINFFINRTALSELFDVFLHEFWPVDKVTHLATRYNEVYRKTARNMKIYTAILCCCIIQISCFPVVLSVRALPYGFYLFGVEDTVLQDSPYFELAYLLQCWTFSVSYVALLILFDLLFIVMAGCLTVQFDVLKHVLLSVGEHEADEDLAYEIIKESVRHHNRLLKFVADLEQFVTVPILKQYLDAISCMGVYIYMAQREFHFMYVFSLVTNLSQTLFFSTFGQLIQDKSAAIADAAYESNWQNLRNPRLQQTLIMIIQRAQRVPQITAGGFITLSFESFVVMVKTAASFLAFLRSTEEE